MRRFHFGNGTSRNISKILKLRFFFQNAERNLNAKINTVEEFVDHLTFLSQISDEIPRLEIQFQEVVKLFGTAFKYNAVLSGEEKALYKTLAPSFLQLKVVN